MKDGEILDYKLSADGNGLVAHVAKETRKNSFTTVCRDVDEMSVLEAWIHWHLYEASPTGWMPGTKTATKMPDDPIVKELTPEEAFCWIRRWWSRDKAWRDKQRELLGPDSAQMLRRIAESIEKGL